MAQDARLVMRVSPAILKAVDEWRRTQPDIPTRSEAVRRMLEIAAKNEATNAAA